LTSGALSLKAVCKRFGPHRALDGVSLDLPAAECAVVLGPSGCGKTTLLRVIAGLETPDSGEIWLGRDKASAAGRILLAPHERRLGFVFQDLALWPHLTVRQNLEFVLEAREIPVRERLEKVTEALRTVRIETFIDRYPHQLSGGEQQRMALARALVGQPRILVLDEPLSSLDAELKNTLRQELARLQRSLRLAMIYVSHDRDDATALADSIVEMRDGRIVSITGAMRKDR
jgi:ABC-type Fe3+/spermidine/putrescine transport system ATPase subunit